MLMTEAAVRALLVEVWNRVMRGEDVDAVLADLAQRDAERRAAFAAERARLQAEAGYYGAIVARYEGRPQ